MGSFYEIPAQTCREFGLVSFAEFARVEIPLQDANQGLKDDVQSVIRKMEADGSTNLGDAIEVAYSMIEEADAIIHKQTFFIILTDGDANGRGMLHASQFESFVKKHPFVNLYSYVIGIGSEYKYEILQTLGQFSHLGTENQIAQVIGSILFEVSNSVSMRAELDLGASRGVRLISSSLHPARMNVIPLGFLFKGRTFTFLAEIEQGGFLVTMVSHYVIMKDGSLGQKTLQSLPTGDLSRWSEPTPAIKRLYFETVKASVLSHYKNVEAPEMDDYCQWIYNTIALWRKEEDPIAREIAESFENDYNALCGKLGIEAELQAASNVVGSTLQTYLDPGENEVTQSAERSSYTENADDYIQSTRSQYV